MTQGQVSSTWLARTVYPRTGTDQLKHVDGWSVLLPTRCALMRRCSQGLVKEYKAGARGKGMFWASHALELLNEPNAASILYCSECFKSKKRSTKLTIGSFHVPKMPETIRNPMFKGPASSWFFRKASIPPSTSASPGWLKPRPKMPPPFSTMTWLRRTPHTTPDTPWRSKLSRVVWKPSKLSLTI